MTPVRDMYFPSGSCLAVVLFDAIRTESTVLMVPKFLHPYTRTPELPGHKVPRVMQDLGINASNKSRHTHEDRRYPLPQ